MIKKLFLRLIHPKTILSKLLVALGVLALLVFAEIGYLDPIIGFLKSPAFRFSIGDFQITIFQIIKAIILIIILLWFASVLSVLFSRKISQMQKINPSDRNLVNKIFQILLYCIIFIIGLNAMGIDLTALTILSGAIGIGIGFGLQKIASNFISGIILLFEKSIEEGDMIELDDGTYGTVKKTNARYTLIETFDSREVFIPNEDFITSRVTNWTYSNHFGRITIEIGVSYDTDLELAKKLITEAAIEHPLSSTEKKPDCFLNAFGDSSVNFTLIFWVNDVIQGRLLPKSEVMFAIWHKFKAHNIQIPFPQRDLHIKNLKDWKAN